MKLKELEIKIAALEKEVAELKKEILVDTTSNCCGATIHPTEHPDWGYCGKCGEPCEIKGTDTQESPKE